MYEYCETHDITYPFDMACTLCSVVSRETSRHNIDTPASIEEAYETIDRVNLRVEAVANNMHEIGRLLNYARDREHWRILEYDSFTAYLRDRFSQSRATLYKAMQVAEVSEALGFPVSQRQAAALSSPAKQAEVKAMVDQGEPPAEAVRQVVQPPRPASPASPQSRPAEPELDFVPEAAPATTYRIIDMKPPGSAGGSASAWTPADWYEPVTRLEGFVSRKPETMQKAQDEIAAVCDSRQADRGRVIEAFARAWPLLRAKYGHTDPVASLRRNVSRSINDVLRSEGATVCICPTCGNHHQASPVTGKPDDRLNPYYAIARGE